MNKILLLLLTAVLGIAPAQAGDMRRLSVNGIERTYYLHVPTGLRSGAPLVIMLHGRDDDGKTDVDRYGWERVANGNRFVVAGPDAPTLHAGRAPSRENYTMWNSEPGTPGDIAKSDDTAFIAAMIDSRRPGASRSYFRPATRTKTHRWKGNVSWSTTGVNSMAAPRRNRSLHQEMS